MAILATVFFVLTLLLSTGVVVMLMVMNATKVEAALRGQMPDAVFPGAIAAIFVSDTRRAATVRQFSQRSIAPLAW